MENPAQPQETSIPPQVVIDSLAEEIKRLSVDNAVLRAALSQTQKDLEELRGTNSQGPEVLPVATDS